LRAALGAAVEKMRHTNPRTLEARVVRKQKRPRNSLDRFVHDSCKIRQASSVRYFLAFFFAFFAFFAPFFAAFFLATVILLTEPNL